MGDLDRSWLVRSALLCLVLLLCVARNYFGSTDQIQNADALAAAVMLQSGKPVRISLGRRRSSPAGAYSQWMCVGNLEEIGSIEHRTCLFENVCYNKDESDFVFFERPGNVSMPVIFDHRHGSQHRFRWRRRDGQPVLGPKYCEALLIGMSTSYISFLAVTLRLIHPFHIAAASDGF
eukprot:6211480-Pleurochrysis_carterae.AAC.2